VCDFGEENPPTNRQGSWAPPSVRTHNLRLTPPKFCFPPFVFPGAGPAFKGPRLGDPQATAKVLARTSNHKFHLPACVEAELEAEVLAAEVLAALVADAALAALIWPPTLPLPLELPPLELPELLLLPPLKPALPLEPPWPPL